MVAAWRSLAAAAIHAKSLNQVLNLAAAVTSATLGVDSVKIFFIDRPQGTLKLQACCEKELARLPTQPAIQSINSIVEMVAQSGKAAIFENCAADPFYHQFAADRSMSRDRHGFFAALPIRGKSQTSGVLACSDGTPRELSSTDSDFIEAITDQLAAALDNFHLSEQLEMTRGELARQTDELERQRQARALVSLFIAGEARTRLNSIAATIHKLREQALGAITLEQDKALETMGAASDSLLATLNTLLP